MVVFQHKEISVFFKGRLLVVIEYTISFIISLIIIQKLMSVKKHFPTLQVEKMLSTFIIDGLLLKYPSEK
jgi:hypothetical protein